VGALLAGVYGVHAVYEGDWHQWSAARSTGNAVRQTIALPGGWRPPPGGRAELRLYIAGRRDPTYEPVVSVNGHEVARLGPALGEAGPLRFWEKIMVAARNQGKTRAEVAQWIAAPVDLGAFNRPDVEVELSVTPVAGGSGAAALWIWGDYQPRPGLRLYEGPPAYSRIQGQAEAFLKYIATGEYGIWRWQTLQSARVQAARLLASDGSGQGAWRTDDLSPAAGRQAGEYRIRLIVYAPNGDLAAIF